MIMGRPQIWLVQSAPAAVLEREFLPLRAKLLEIGAILNRMDRSDGSVDGDSRRRKVESPPGHPPIRRSRPSRTPSDALSLPYDEHWQQKFQLSSHSPLSHYPMYYIDPHIHMVSRTTDDYETLAKMGCVAMSEPAFWAGFDRGSVDGFRDYFRQLTEFEPKRAGWYRHPALHLAVHQRQGGRERHACRGK